MDYCGNCAYPLSPSEEHCTYCGTDASRPCPHCRAPIPRGTSYACPRCGGRIDQAAGPPSPTAPGPPQGHPATFQPSPTQAAFSPAGPGFNPFAPVGAGASAYSPVAAGPTQQPGSPSFASPQSPPRMSDPVEVLSLELGISHLKAKRLVDSGVAIEHLRRMAESDITRLLQDPETARVIKLRVGHEVTERQARGELDEVKRSVEPLVRLARELGAPATDLETQLERASDAISGSRPAEVMDAVRLLREAAPTRRAQLLARTKGELATQISYLELAGVDASRLRDSTARIDVAIAKEDSAEGARAAQEGLAAAREMSSRIDSVRRGAARCEEVVALLESLSKEVLALRGELRICDALMSGGKWEEAERTIDRVQSEAARQVQDALAGAIVREKRRVFDLKLRGQDVSTHVATLRQSQVALRKGAVNDAVTQFRKYQEIAGVARTAGS